MAWGNLYIVIHMFLWIFSLWIYFLLIPPSAGSKILTVAQNSLCLYLSALSLEMGLFNQHFFIIIIIIIFFILERGFHKETLKFLSRVFDSRREAAVGACSAVSGCVFSVFSLLASWWQGN